jgi:hypothetical protein
VGTGALESKMEVQGVSPGTAKKARQWLTFAPLPGVSTFSCGALAAYAGYRKYSRFWETRADHTATRNNKNEHELVVGPCARIRSANDRRAERDRRFLTLWSLFEARILNNRGNARAIRDAVDRWRDTGTLGAASYNEQLVPRALFRERCIYLSLRPSSFAS